MGKVRFDMTGVAPVLQKNVRLSDPLDPAAQYLSELVDAKKAKDRSEEEHISIAHAEYMGSLYWDEEMGPYVPTRWLEASFKKGAAPWRKGKVVQSGLLFFEEGFPLVYDGPRTQAGLWDDENFRLTVMARTGQARVPRTRPMFRHWALSAEAHLDTTAVPLKLMRQIAEYTGVYVGIGDWRPKYGRFTCTIEEI